MARKVFRPTIGQIVWLIAVGAGALGAALYMRYRIIEVSAVGLACDAGMQDWGQRLADLEPGSEKIEIVAITEALSPQGKGAQFPAPRLANLANRIDRVLVGRLPIRCQTGTEKK